MGILPHQANKLSKIKLKLKKRRKNLKQNHTPKYPYTCRKTETPSNIYNNYQARPRYPPEKRHNKPLSHKKPCLVFSLVGAEDGHGRKFPVELASVKRSHNSRFPRRPHLQYIIGRSHTIYDIFDRIML